MATTPNEQNFVIPSTYRVYPVEGFVTSIMAQPADATLQITYWIVDGTPDVEDNSLPYGNVEHYKFKGVKHALQTAIQLRPNVAYQMAMNILENLTKLPEAVRAKYQLPSGIQVHTGAQ
ncbi:MAG: hypothetical protein KGJ66_14155 [Alphaproteobacteria bacterium]|nr:hypothetical protein [Alphaproteobacteria bacterium]